MTLLKRALLPTLAVLAAAAAWGEPADAPEKPANVVLAIHGGAGAPPAKEMTPARKAEYVQVLKEALQKGHEALKQGTSLDAVEAAIKVMEDSPLFNAGRGAVFTHEGRNELDASIMEGKERRAGAVAGVTRVKNPITAARKVMEESEHVLLVGDGADRFAISKGVKEVNPVYYWTPERWKQLQDALKEEEQKKKPGAGAQRARPADRHFGTVGAVALKDGDLAAGTSTGGLTNKRHGRVGDSPIIGAGTYADNQACAVSCTGHGEVFIRHAVAHEIVALMKYKDLSVEDAARKVLGGLPPEKEGVGGLIALDGKGHLAMPFDTDGMYRGYVTNDGKMHVAIYQKFEE
jgi:beta-aspartyl-peptidase (threonine type)